MSLQRITIPLRLLTSACNLREHWAVRARRVKREREAVLVHLQAKATRPALPCTVTFVRVGPVLLDHGNLAGACKAPEDATAGWLGVDDGPEGPVTWRYRQERGRPYALRIEIEDGGE